MQDKLRALAIALALLTGWGPSWAQTQLARKPSGYHPSGQQHASTRGVAAGWLPRIDTTAQLTSLLRTYDAGTPLALPHLLFVIDRGHDNQVFYLDSRRYALHEDFLKSQRGLANLGPAGWKAQYRDPQRRYLLGTISRPPGGPGWVYEFWEGDPLSPELLRLAQQRLGETFVEALRFKPNASAQEALATQLDLPSVTQASLIAGQGFLALNPGTAVGRLRVVEDAEAVDDLAPDEIVLLKQVPLILPPVAGVISTRPSTTLSHVNLLTRGWGIPNAWVREVQDWPRLAGQWVRLEVSNTGVSLQPVPASRAPFVGTLRQVVRTGPSPDLQRSSLVALDDLTLADRRRCGSKAANLGVLSRAQRRGTLPGVAPVPGGFCIPFAAFVRFMAQPAAQQALQQARATPGFSADRRQRAAALAALRARLVSLPIPDELQLSWQRAWQTQLGGTGVFVRSSSNSEDLPGFSGAGLYTTVPNVTRPDALAQAVKTVWASLFNADAWEARQWAGVPHDAVVMGVLVQQAVDAQASGVMVTLNPFDPQQPGMSYVSAKRGLGIRVVEGQRQAEQVLHSRRSGAVQVLSRSDDPVALLLDEHGGVREAAVAPGLAVLNDALVGRLAHVGQAVQRLLGPGPQDIEWAINPQGQVVLLQARPYVDRSARAGLTDLAGR
jgi:hypothetical protein